MSKLNVGVGEDFPLGEDANQNEGDHPCARWRNRHGRRHGHHRHGPGAAAAIVVIPAGVAAVTTAILYPLTTLGVIGGLGLVAAAHHRGRWAHYRDEMRRRWREEHRRSRDDERRDQYGPQPDRPNDKPEPPKEGV